MLESFPFTRWGFWQMFPFGSTPGGRGFLARALLVTRAQVLLLTQRRAPHSRVRRTPCSGGGFFTFRPTPREETKMPPDPLTLKRIPFEMYKPIRPLPLALPERQWPSRQIEKAPVWC